VFEVVARGQLVALLFVAAGDRDELAVLLCVLERREHRHLGDVAWGPRAWEL
jgi:hypothetical protein